jgi:hypothetical protein
MDIEIRDNSLARFNNDKVNYSEYPITHTTKLVNDIKKYGEDHTPNQIQNASKLKNGVYDAKWYGNTLELSNGELYMTKNSIGKGKEYYSGYDRIQITDGIAKVISKFKKKSFSGYAEIGPGLQGASYGAKPVTVNDITRLTFDSKGFHIPPRVQHAFKLKNKTYSMIDDKNGRWMNNRPEPQISISRDNSIIRSKSRGNGLDSPKDDTTPLMPNKMTNVALDWNKNEAFHLAVEPWLTSNLLSDTSDGLYLGNIKGDKVDTGDKVITLMVSVKVDYPEAVLVLVKNQKAYIFKQSALQRSTGSRIFTNVIFSEIKSPEQFRDYAHNLMANAHKSNYNPKITDKVANGILRNSKDYGEAVGKLKSSLKHYSDFNDMIRSFADADKPNDDSDDQDSEDKIKEEEEELKRKAAELEKRKTDLKAKRQESEVKDKDAKDQENATDDTKDPDVNQSGDQGKSGTGEAQNQPGDESQAKTGTGKANFKRGGADPKESTEQPAPSNAPNAFKTAKPDTSSVSSIDPNKPAQVEDQHQDTPDDNKSRAIKDKDSEDEIDYRFEVEPSDLKIEMQCLIGTLVMSPAYVHLFHLCTTDYAAHMALEEFYKKMPELVDRLAENYLATTATTNFQVCVVPNSLDPVKYLESLQEYIIRYQTAKLNNESAFQSLVDDISNLIGVTLYRLKRLKMGRKVFSFIKN